MHSGHIRINQLYEIYDPAGGVAGFWNTSTYRLRTGRLDACDFGRPGGGGATRNDPDGDADGDADEVSSGTKLDLTRGTVFLGGEFKSTAAADAGRAGGGGPEDRVGDL